MKYLPQYELYIDDDCVVYRVAKRDGRRYTKGKLYQVKIQNGKDGYRVVSYYDKRCDKWHTVALHRVIATAFIPNTENKPTVDHINRNKLDNRVCNLRWATYAEQELNKDRTERARALHMNCRSKVYDSEGNVITNEETRTYHRCHYKLHADRFRLKDRNRYYKDREKRKDMVMNIYRRNMQTKRRVMFADGSHHWMPVEQALQLFKKPVKERQWISK